jgi:hypothetical protein
MGRMGSWAHRYDAMRGACALLGETYVNSLSRRFSAMRILGHRNMTVGSKPGFFQLKEVVSANCLDRAIRRFL